MDIKIHIIHIYLSLHVLRYINTYISIYTCLKYKRTASPIDQINRISQGYFLDLSEVLKEDLSVESSLLTEEQEFERIQVERLESLVDARLNVSSLAAVSTTVADNGPQNTDHWA